MRATTALRALPATLREMRPAVAALWSQTERLPEIGDELRFVTLAPQPAETGSVTGDAADAGDLAGAGAPAAWSTAAPAPAGGAARASRPVHRRLPVMLVHGYGGNPGVWAPLRAALDEAGFHIVVAAHYNALATDVPDVAARIADKAAQVAADAGTEGVHLVGHSLGGLIARFAVHCDVLAEKARTLVTVATPHAGSPLARWGVGLCARRMRPDSPWLADLGACDLPRATRWVNFYSDVDLVVPAWSARVMDPRVVNIPVAGRGHLAITSYPHLISSIVTELVLSELRESFDRRPPELAGPRADQVAA